jgi:hypothetical protein
MIKVETAASQVNRLLNLSCYLGVVDGRNTECQGDEEVIAVTKLAYNHYSKQTII